MTATLFPVTPVTPAALSAFLRGVERRALVVALLQCGDRASASRVLTCVLGDFRRCAQQVLMAEWPVQFWRRLVAATELRHAGASGHWPADCTPLVHMHSEDRLALLLRIVAGLDEAMAGVVLGVGEDDYCAALARACPRDREGRPDAAAWRALAEAAQAQLRALPPQWLEALRTEAETPASAQPTVDREMKTRQWRSRSWRGSLWPVAALLVVALALLGWLRRPSPLPPEPVSQALPGALHVVDAAPVRVETLPADDNVPAAAVNTPSRQQQADAAMLADPDLLLARHADFYAWFAAGAPMPANEAEPAAGAAGVQPATGLETVDDEN